MFRLCVTLFVICACIPANAFWGVTRDLAGRSPEMSKQLAPVMLQRGVDCVALDTNGLNGNWPGWIEAQKAWSGVGISTFWSLPSGIAACERVFGSRPGTLGIDDRPVGEDGSPAKIGLNYLDPDVAFQLRRASKAFARRMKSAEGYRVAPGITPQVPYDEHARRAWQKFLAGFFADATPAEDTNHDLGTFNSAYGTSYGKWEDVGLFSTEERRDERKQRLVDLWLAQSWTALVNSMCGELKTIDRKALIGPGVPALFPPSVDISLLACGKGVDAIYAEGCESAQSVAAFASTFGRDVMVASGSVQKALDALPYARGVCFDSSEVIAVEKGEQASVKPALQTIPRLAPFVGKFEVKWSPVLWIAGSAADTRDIVDSHCVTESALAVDPDCVDFTRYKAVIYDTNQPCSSLAIMQKLFSYALKGGVVFIDANRIASTPTLRGQDNLHFWLPGMERRGTEIRKGSSTITCGDFKGTFGFDAPYVTGDESKLQVSGKVESGGVTYPLVLVSKLGQAGKWVYLNWPLIWDTPELLNKIVLEQAGVSLPDPDAPRVYKGEKCVLALGGKGTVGIDYEQKKAAVLDVVAGKGRVITAKDGRLTLADEMKPDERGLWVVKPYGQPVVLYIDGTRDYAGSIDDGVYSGNKLKFRFTEKAWVSSPTKPKSLTINGKAAPFEYDEEQHLITITRTGPTADAELEYAMAKTFVTKGYSDEDIILLLNLQGLANRNGARLFYDTEGRNDWSRSDRRWMEIYKERKGIGFEPLGSLDELVSEFRDSIGGLVVYDPALDASRYVALTLAGINGWLAVSPAQMKGEIAKLPIKEDLRGRWTDGVKAYEWAIENLRPQCSDSIAYSAGQSHDDVNLGSDPGIILALDYAISHKAFVFNLSPCPEPATYDYEKQHVKGHPEDVRLMDKIFSTYKAPAKIYGWNEPEWKFTSRISRAGHMLMCGRGANLSFHEHVPCEMKQFKQVAETHPTPIPIEDKYYVAFMTNEGDTPRVITTFMFGAWEDPNRGKLMINWGISPTLIADFPALAEYYYSTATPNDYFYAGCSGTGYSFIDQLPDVANFARFGAPHFKAADIDIADAWDEFAFHPEHYETYAKEAGIKLFTLLPRGESGPKLLPSGVPVFVPHGKVHYKETGFEERMEGIKAVTDEHKAPFIIPLYGGVKKTAPSDYLKIAEALDKDKFEVISLAQMALMAKEMAGK